MPVTETLIFHPAHKKNACKFNNEEFHKQRVALLRFWKQTSFSLEFAHTDIWHRLQAI